MKSRKQSNSASANGLAWRGLPYEFPCDGCGYLTRRPDRRKFLCRYCNGTKPYPREWKKIRETVLRRDDFACTVCGRECDRLDIHHKDGDTANNSMKNLVTKCRQCHISNHKNKGRVIKKISHHDFGVRIEYFKPRIPSFLYKLTT